MIIKTLVENTSISEDFGSEHGLSLYIETKKHKILFDVGASDLFVKNAQKMNVNISDIDYLVISHGHNDHGGGLKTFFKYNNKAKVFINEKGFEKHYALRKNGNLEFIGLDEELKQNKQIIFTGENFSISDGIEVFSNVVQKRPGPISNSTLFMKQNGILMNDTFSHEQNLVIEEDGKTLLVTGCAHNGIVNIMEHFYNLKKREPNYVIGGFHLSSRSLGSSERIETTQEIGKYLLKTDVKYYTCHCTGIESYKRLKDVMGEKIDYLSAGSELKI
ncbi:MBL fold metallo-hydrolase [Clostridium sp. BJN0001]|uniref:MBL fold metallo-hydrolase n=1 Tax=Clostridium sp. BJN0001 TaxID=2930219 RepID=UPI001FD07983|nr:MBL fold metallo-hydrolase [Clostridium sp. BJN0001]